MMICGEGFVHHHSSWADSHPRSIRLFCRSPVEHSVLKVSSSHFPSNPGCFISLGGNRPWIWCGASLTSAGFYYWCIWRILPQFLAKHIHVLEYFLVENVLISLCALIWKCIWKFTITCTMKFRTFTSQILLAKKLGRPEKFNRKNIIVHSDCFPILKFTCYMLFDKKFPNCLVKPSYVYVSLTHRTLLVTRHSLL